MIETDAVIPLLYFGCPVHGSPVLVSGIRPMPAVVAKPCLRTIVL